MDAFEFLHWFVTTSKNIVYSRLGVAKSIKISNVTISEVLHFSSKGGTQKLLAEAKGGFFVEIVKKTKTNKYFITWVSNWVFLCNDFLIFQHFTVNKPKSLVLCCFEKLYFRKIPHDRLPLPLQSQYQFFIRAYKKYKKATLLVVRDGIHEKDKRKICRHLMKRYDDSDDDF